MILPDIENATEKILVSNKTGYAYLNNDIKIANIDPISKSQLKGDAIEMYTNVLDFSECEGVPSEKISCIEEERNRSGYEILSYFNFPHGIENAKSVVLKKEVKNFYNYILAKLQILLRLIKS